MNLEKAWMGVPAAEKTMSKFRINSENQLNWPCLPIQVTSELILPACPQKNPKIIYTRREQKLVEVVASEIGLKLLIELRHLK